MKLLIYSDIHNDVRALERLMSIDADYYFCAGDLVSWARGFDKMGPVMAKRASQTFVLPGNHESVKDIEEFCARFGCHPFHERTLDLPGWHVAGLGYSNPTPFDTPGEYTEQELAERLAAFSNLKPLVLICHTPPRDTPLDQGRSGEHFGSQAVRDFIERYQPEHFFCGHIHEAEGVSAEIGKTHGMNVGKRGYLLEL